MRQRKTLIAITFLASLFLVSCMGEIPVIGLDKSGEAFEAMLSTTKYKEELRNNLSAIQETVIPEMDAQSGKKRFHLRWVYVGLGVRGQIGIGEYFTLAGNIGFDLGFSNKE